MTTKTTIRSKVRGLDRRLELARKRIQKQDREEVQATNRAQAEYRQWMTKRAVSFRRAMTLFQKVFRLMRQLDIGWRGRVYCREQKYSEDADHAIRTLHAVWFAYAELFEERAGYFHRHGTNFATELDALASHKREVSQVLRGWRAPAPGRGPSFRPVTLSPEAVARFRELFPGRV